MLDDEDDLSEADVSCSIEASLAASARLRMRHAVVLETFFAWPLGRMTGIGFMSGGLGFGLGFLSFDVEPEPELDVGVGVGLAIGLEVDATGGGGVGLATGLDVDATGVGSGAECLTREAELTEEARAEDVDATGAGGGGGGGGDGAASSSSKCKRAAAPPSSATMR